jgi:hypothetical protein
MQPVSKKFGKGLAVGIVGFVVFFLLVFFVVMFFSGHRQNASRPMVSTGTMMKGSSVNMALPSTTTKKNQESSMKKRMGIAMDAAAPVDVMMEARSGSVSMMGVEQKMMKNGSLSLQVENIDQATAKARAIAEELGGTVTNSFFDQATGSIKTGSVTVSVPVAQFGEALSRLKGIAVVVLSENTSGTDVTEQYIDLQARISNMRAAEVAYQALLDKAEKVSDVIEVTDKLSAVRSEIESLEGQLRYLSSQTDKASVTIFMTEDRTITGDQSFRPEQTFKESVVMLLQVLGHFVQGVIMLAILGLPMFLVYGLLLWVIYRLVHKLMHRVWHGNSEEKKRIVRRKVN